MAQRKALLPLACLGLGAGLLGMAAPPVAQAESGSCTTTADVGSKVWKVAGPSVKKAIATSGPFGATAATTIGFIEDGIKIWNKIAGDSSWAKIGPRRMDFDKWNEGTLIGPTERLFLSSFPAVNPVTVDVNKLDHDGKVKVVVCKKPEKGGAVEVKTFTIDKDTKKGNVKSIDIDDAKGHIISIALHGKSVANKLNYKVRAKFKYDDEAVKKAQSTRTVSGDRGTSSTTKSAPRTPENSKSAPRSPSTSKSAPR